MNIYTYIYIHLLIYLYEMYIYIYIYIFTYMYIYIYVSKIMSIFIFLCLYLHISIHNDLCRDYGLWVHGHTERAMYRVPRIAFHSTSFVPCTAKAPRGNVPISWQGVLWYPWCRASPEGAGAAAWYMAGGSSDITLTYHNAATEGDHDDSSRRQR